MARKKFTLFLLPQQDRGYQAHFPYYPGCFTWGATVEEALGRARDAIATHLDGLVDAGLDVGLDLAELPHVVVADVEVELSPQVLKKAEEEAAYEVGTVDEPTPQAVTGR